MIQRSRFGVLPLLILTVHSALAQSPGSEKTLVVMLGTGTPLPDPARSGQRRQNGNQVANLKRSEARQLRNAKRGNAIVFETACEALRPRLLKIAQRITRNREDAEDAVQDSLMRAYLHIEDRRKPDGASGFRKAPIFERPDKLVTPCVRIFGCDFVQIFGTEPREQLGRTTIEGNRLRCRFFLPQHRRNSVIGNAVFLVCAVGITAGIIEISEQ